MTHPLDRLIATIDAVGKAMNGMSSIGGADSTDIIEPGLVRFRGREKRRGGPFCG